MNSGPGGGNSGVDSCSDASVCERYSPHPHEMYFHNNHNHSHNHNGHKLSLQPIERYDDALSCCLPPPSPAPNSDRCLVGLTTASSSSTTTIAAASATTTTAPTAISCGASCSASLQSVHMTTSMSQQYDNYDCSLHSLIPNSTPAAIGQVQKTSQQQQQHQLSLSLSSSTSKSSLCTTNSSTNSGQNLIHHSHHTANASNSNRNAVYSPNGRYGRHGNSMGDNSLMTASSSSPATASGSRFTPSSTHMFSQNTATPLISSDAYSYLSSTVHTPVKRYVPTPPLTTNELYSDVLGTTAAAPSSSCSSTSSSAPCKSNIAGTMYTPSLRTYHMKCCLNDPQPPQPQTQQTHLEHQQDGILVSDYYDTPNRQQRSAVSNMNCDKYCNNNNVNKKVFGKDVLEDTAEGQVSNNSHKSNNCLNIGINASSSINSLSAMKACSGESPITVSSTASASCRPLQGVPSAGRFMNDTATADYLASNGNAGGNYKKSISNCVVDKNSVPNGRFIVPVTSATMLDNADNTSASTSNATGQSSSVLIKVGNNYDNPNGATSTQAVAPNSGTCLHCNTVRRTTGVHQTTQTTGPISPIPSLPHITATPTSNHNQYHHANVPSGQDELVSTIHHPSANNEVHFSPLSPTPSTHQLDAHNFHLNNIAGTGSKNKLQQTTSPQNTFLDHNMVNICHQQQQQQQQQQHHHQTVSSSMHTNAIETQQQQQQQQQHEQSNTSNMQQSQQHFSRKKRISNYLRKEISRFFGIDESTELEEYTVWQGRQRRLAIRRFGSLKNDGGAMQTELNRSIYNGGDNSAQSFYNSDASDNSNGNNRNFNQQPHQQQQQHHSHPLHRHHYHHNHIQSERPDILPAQDTGTSEENNFQILSNARGCTRNMGVTFQLGDHVERKPSVAAMIISCFTYLLHALHKHETPQARTSQQWSRSFAPKNVTNATSGDGASTGANTAAADNTNDIPGGLQALQEDELFFDTPTGFGGGVIDQPAASFSPGVSPTSVSTTITQQQSQRPHTNLKGMDHNRPMYIVGERVNGWRTSSLMGVTTGTTAAIPIDQQKASIQQQVGQSGQQKLGNGNVEDGFCNLRGKRIAPQLLDGVLENSRRPMEMRVKLFSINDLDDRPDYRPFFTYWINTVQILVVLLSIICYGIGPIGIGVDQRTGQVLVTSLSLQTVQHTEQRNLWIGPRNNDLVHMGAKFATCMRRDVKIMNVLLKTRRQERETACCIRNDDSGCVQSSQADCSVRGLFPTKSISTWKKWSPGESGPGGRISGSVCGLDPKYCDAPASIAPYEWPDDITKWPICRKTNSFSHRFRYKDHTAEHMVCEVIGHPCCTGVYGECRITTREYCDFVNGYFHEEASLCSQISCLNNVCGMFPFLSVEVPDQFYRLFTSLCLHAGILHLIITVAFQHVYLADLERLIGPLRTAIVYIGSGLAGNLTSAVLVPYKPEVGPLASLVGVVASLVVLLIFTHWKHLSKPYIALFKLILMGAFLFAIGTLPWQLNFAGLIAGILCAIILTIAFVPFVSINKYKRKNKINLIWFCIIIHSILYSIMFVVFYLFPMELTNLNFAEIFNNNFNPIVISNSADYITSSISSNNRYPSMPHQQQQLQQHYYHHQSNDIINNAASLSDGSNIAVKKFV